jgi:transcriptional regulator with XRE-family HTH domain
VTPTEIVAKYLKRIRTEWGLSRRAFAEKIGWTEHKLLDLEHGRDRRRVPSPDELFALCAHSQITLVDLFLPPPGIEQIELPLDAMNPTTPLDSFNPVLDRSTYAQMLFGIPSQYLEPDALPGFRKSLADESVKQAILTQHPSVVQILAPLRQRHREILRDLTAALIAEGEVSLQSDAGETVVVDPTQVHMSVDEARAEEAEARQLVAGALNQELRLLERRIDSGELPKPPQPKEPQKVWGAYVRGHKEPLDQLAAEWLAQIEQEDD